MQLTKNEFNEKYSIYRESLTDPISLEILGQEFKILENNEKIFSEIDLHNNSMSKNEQRTAQYMVQNFLNLKDITIINTEEEKLKYLDKIMNFLKDYFYFDNNCNYAILLKNQTYKNYGFEDSFELYRNNRNFSRDFEYEEEVKNYIESILDLTLNNSSIRKIYYSKWNYSFVIDIENEENSYQLIFDFY